MIKFKQDTELAVVTKFDEQGDTLEESNETFREGVEVDATMMTAMSILNSEMDQSPLLSKETASKKFLDKQ